MGRLSTRLSSSAWVSPSIQCRSSNDQEQRLHLALAQQQALDRVERALAALGRVEGLPGRVVDRHVEQREQRRQQWARARGPGPARLPSHLLAHLPVIVAVADLEVALEQVDHGQVAGGLAVGDRRGLQDQPVLHPMRVGELVDEPRLAHPGLAHEGHHLAVARAGLAEDPAQVLELGVAADEAREAPEAPRPAGACAPCPPPSARRPRRAPASPFTGIGPERPAPAT